MKNNPFNALRWIMLILKEHVLYKECLSHPATLFGNTTGVAIFSYN